MIQLTDEMAAKHYSEHANKPFFQALKNFITSGPIIASGQKAKMRLQALGNFMGKTNP